MPKRKKPEISDKEQFERFVETSRKIGADESGKPLEDAFKHVTKDRSRKKSSVQREP